MLIIREQQCRAMTEALLTRFEEEMFRHLTEHFPQHCETLQDGGVRAAIRYGIERAASYGMRTACEVTLFIQLMFLFGRYFDSDPKLPWASRILSDPSLGTGTRRVEGLLEASIEHSKTIMPGST